MIRTEKKPPPQHPRVGAADLLAVAGERELAQQAGEALPAVETELKYAGYVARERERAERLREQAGFQLVEDLPYQEFATLSHEAREKLQRIRPVSLAQAGRIPGVSPSDLQNLVLEVRRWRRSNIR